MSILNLWRSKSAHTRLTYTVAFRLSVCAMTYHSCWNHTLGDCNGNCIIVRCRSCAACRPSVHGCLKGTAGLQAAAAVQLQPSQTAMLVKALLEVPISSLPQADRMMALTILSTALKVVSHDFSCAQELQGCSSILPGMHTFPLQRVYVWLQICWNLSTHTSGRYKLQKGYFGQNRAR